MNVLGVETSCDETAIAVVRDGRRVLSNVIASQVDLHARYGGVFPEMASRQHVLAITPVLEEALSQAGVGWSEIGAIAATYGPGLAGSLVVGLNFAKGLALAQGLPLIGVNHLEGHIYASWLARTDAEEATVPHPEFPVLVLIVSGGHTELILMRTHGDYTLLGQTRDDAAGEAFDKVARLLGLPYPGGPPIQKVAGPGNPQAFTLPRAMLQDESYDFSFSGLKTAVLRVVEQYTAAEGMGAASRGEVDLSAVPVADVAASFQQALIDVLVAKTKRAAVAFGVRQVLLGGGVAANGPLRAHMATALADLDLIFHYPPPILCTDNGAAIAATGYWRLQSGAQPSVGVDVVPNLRLTSS